MDNRTDNEKFYDEELAPALLEVGKKCEARGMSCVLLVEYDAGEIGETRILHPGASKGLLAASRQFSAPPMLKMTTKDADGNTTKTEYIASL